MVTNAKLFWKNVMPVCVATYSWGSDLAGCKTQEAFEKGLKRKVKSMDEGEFDLFMAAIVMESSKKQIMGVDLTEQIRWLRELKK